VAAARPARSCVAGLGRRRIRQGLSRAIGSLQGGAEQAGLRTGPVGIWVYEHKRALRIGAVALAALALVF
jgi:hypothetical protein